MGGGYRPHVVRFDTSSLSRLVSWPVSDWASVIRVGDGCRIDFLLVVGLSEGDKKAFSFLADFWVSCHFLVVLHSSDQAKRCAVLG